MSTFTERLNEAMTRYDVSIHELSRRTGINIGTLSHYKRGNYDPKQGNIYLMAKALNVSPGWLLGLDLPEREVLLDEEILNMWHRLSDSQQDEILLHIESLLAGHTEEP